MSSWHKLPLCLLFFFLGASAIAVALFGQRFFFKPLGSSREGPTMPGWLARTFFAVVGLVFLFAAIDTWRSP